MRGRDGSVEVEVRCASSHQSGRLLRVKPTGGDDYGSTALCPLILMLQQVSHPHDGAGSGTYEGSAVSDTEHVRPRSGVRVLSPEIIDVLGSIELPKLRGRDILSLSAQR